MPGVGRTKKSSLTSYAHCGTQTNRGSANTMAQDKQKPVTGGNKPKPPAGGGNNPTQSAKDRSRAQSRPVSGKAPTGKSGQAAGAARAKPGGGGGNKPRPGTRPAAAPQPRRFSGAMMAWGAVVLVVVIVGVLVVVKVAGGGSNSGSNAYTPVTAAPAAVVHDVTNIPTSVFNQVGVNFPSAADPTSPPTPLPAKLGPLSIDGKSPAMLYYGAEYCPYCAAERWAMVASLARFGTWSNLKITASSHTDVYAETHTFSFNGATFTSPYLTLHTVEQYTNVPVSGGGYTNLQNPTKEEQKIIDAGQKYIPDATAGQIGFPFINIGNAAIISGATYNPAILTGLSWTDIAGGLDDATNPVTQAIVGASNYISAAVCKATKQAPSSVCMSPGVRAAAKSL
jgi:hypothetical protein